MLRLTKILSFLVLLKVLCFGCHPSFAQDLPINSKESKRIKILSIDGGGIKGLIPALILQNLEARIKNGRHLTDCFDMMTGTSTGGIITLMLNVRDEDGKPKYTASDIVELYKRLGREVFQYSLWRKIKSGWGWVGVKYSEDGLEKILAEYLGEAELKDTLTQVIIPAYEIEEDATIFFRTHKARNNAEYNYLLRDLGRATSAAPTYFNPAKVTDLVNKNKLVLVDGGVSVNNPTLATIVEAVKIYGANKRFLVMSLGCGTNYGAKSDLVQEKSVHNSGLLGWAKEFIPMMMHATNDVTDYQVDYIFNYNNPNSDHFRFQPVIEKEHDELDNISPENIAALESYAQKIIAKNEEALQKIADLINSDIRMELAVE